MTTITRHTTINQHTGNHPSGARFMRLADVRSEYEVPEEVPGAVALVDEAHDLRVAIESLDAGKRIAAWTAVDEAQPDDIEEEIAAMRDALGVATEIKVD